MTIEELRKIRISNDYMEILDLKESEMVDWEATKGEPPYVEEYLLTINIQTYSSKETMVSPVKVRITLPKDYPRSAPIFKAENTVIFHPYWYPSGQWSYGAYSPMKSLVQYIVQMIGELQYDPKVLGTRIVSPSNQAASHWYNENYEDRNLFPCDNQDLKDLYTLRRKKGFRVIKKREKRAKVEFIHPLNGSILTAEIPIDLTVNEIINALVSEKFISAPDKMSGYSLAVNNNGEHLLEGEQKLSDAILKEGENEVIIISQSVAYGCPTANDRIGLVPECMLTEYAGADEVTF